jgi:histidinol-phosphate/aromatic aminotransferase/cobyric acid decarboxylase-like protein
MREPPHGGLHDQELARLGLGPAEVVDFSVNVNPYGPCDAVVRAVGAASLSRYPDPTGHAARVALAGALGCAPDELALGHGAVELLWALARLLVPPGETCAVVGPTFSELPRAVCAGGGRVVEWRASAGDDFAVHLDAVDALCARARPRALYLCSPGNPSGRAVPDAEIAALAARHPRVTLILDQAFRSLSDLDPREPAYPPNVVRVRSLTKDHALAGLRVGYLVAQAALVARLEALRPPWTSSALAQAAIVATTTAEAIAFVARSRRRVLADRDHLVARLAADLGLRAHPSQAPYVLVPAPGATALRRRLLARRRVLVRDASSFGLPDHVRLAARPADDVARLVAALDAELSR